MSINKSEQAHSHKAIIKSAGIIGIATLCSRILGFIRDVVIARLFGVYLYAQAFVIAFKIPNLFRDALGEGAANAAFVPVFSEYAVTRSKEEYWKLVNVVLNLLFVALAGITVLGIIFSPFIVRLVAPGFAADIEKLNTTVTLNRLIFPYILLVSLAAYATAILNSLKHFSIPAFAPCLLNISIIVCAMLFGEGIKGLALGILIGGLLQLAVQVPMLYKKGFRFTYFLRCFTHPAARKIGKLLVPRLFSSGIYQLNNFVDTFFGSLAFIVGEGGVVALYLAYRLIQFPIGIFSNALSQAILPTFSTQALEDTRDKIKRTLSFGLRVSFLVMVPASVGLMVMAKLIVGTLFQGGKFDVYATNMTSGVLIFYAIGLAAYGSGKIINSCFFALQDTVTPAKLSFLALASNIILNSLLICPLKLKGIALATSISGINTCILSLFILTKRLKFPEVKMVIFSFVRILSASLAMGILCWYIMRYNFGANGFGKWIELITMFSVSICSYIVFCFIFRVGELQEALRWMRKMR